MTVIVLSVSERAQLPSVLTPGSTYYITTEGEPECSLGYECDDTTHAGLNCGEPVAPERWRVVSGDCPTCGGNDQIPVIEWQHIWERPRPSVELATGQVMTVWPVVGRQFGVPRIDGLGAGDTTSCPSCRGGRRVVTLQATCPRCGGRGTIFERLAQKNPVFVFGDPCPECDRAIQGPSTVALGSVCVSLLPVVAYGKHDTVGRYVVVEVEPGSSRSFLMGNETLPVDQVELSLDPLPTPGSWVVALEVQP